MTHSAQFLPDREIRLKKTGVWPGIVQYLAALIFAGLAIFFVVSSGPGLLRDWSISRDPIVVEDAAIADGECRTSKGFFVDCSGIISYTVDGRPLSKEISLMFLDIGSGDYVVDVVQSRSHPEEVTLSIGLDYLWNRTITLTLFAGAMALFSAAFIRSGLKSDGARRRAGEPSMLKVVTVPVIGLENVVGGSVVQFQYGADTQGKPLLATSRFGKKEGPLLSAGERLEAVAVIPQGASIPVLLDERLERLDISPDERSRALDNAKLIFK